VTGPEARAGASSASAATRRDATVDAEARAGAGAGAEAAAPGDLVVFAPEIHALFVRPFLDDARDRLGAAEVDALVASLGTTTAALADPSAWVSLRFAEALVEAVVSAEGDPRVLDRAAELSFSAAYMGPLRAVLRAFGTPGFAYAQMARGLPRFNKVGRIRVAHESRGRVVLAYSALPGAPRERSPLICAGRRAQMAALPSLFDLPRAEVRHESCALSGADECVYDVRWRTPRRRGAWLGAAAGSVVGAAAGAAGALLLGPLGGALGGASLGGAAGYALGAVRELRRDLGARTRELHAQNDALLEAARTNEARFAALVEAKASVERVVEERTAALRETAERLSLALTEVKRLDRARTEFFANVSHDLRTPLTLLLGPLEPLAKGAEPPGGRDRAFAAMWRAALRLQALVDQLLDVARIDGGAVRLALGPVDGLALAEAVVAPFAAAAAARGVTLTVAGPASGAATATADAAWLERALANLVANALRYAPDGGRVAVEVTVDATRLRFEVSDDGPGIAPAELERVFERFSQGDDAQGRGGGAGLGLAIVREVASLHGGEAGVTSEPGRGARFHLWIPRAQDAAGARAPSSGEAATAGHGEATARAPRAPAASLLAQSLPGTAPEPATATAPRGPDEAAPSPAAPAPAADDPVVRGGRRARVFVVEDDPDLRAFVAAAVAEEHDVESFADVASALDRAAHVVPDAVVTDLGLPGGRDGLDLVRALRAQPALRGTPILVLTAHRDPTRVLAAFEAGASDYLTKPFQPRELRARLGTHLQLVALARELALRERLAMLGQTAATVAHEVRNPLTSIRSGLPALRRRLGGALDPATRELVEIMEDGAARIDALVGDMLDLSRVDRAERERIDPSVGVRAAARLFAIRLPAAVALTVDVVEGGLVDGRAGDLHQAFLNLLSNAAKAVGDAGRIEVWAGPDGDRWVLRVGDSGPGIAPADRARVLEPFVTTAARGSGTGLGLPLVRQVVEAHGGGLELGESGLGGAEARLWLPLRSRRTP
jgi:signal transduction histidine kinase